MFITQSYLTLCDSTGCNPPGSSVHGILQARILEWVAKPFTRRSYRIQESNLGLLHCKQILYLLSYRNWVTKIMQIAWFYKPNQWQIQSDTVVLLDFRPRQFPMHFAVSGLMVSSLYEMEREEGDMKTKGSWESSINFGNNLNVCAWVCGVDGVNLCLRVEIGCV